MASFTKIIFSEICVNGFRSTDTELAGAVNECAISQRGGRDFLIIKISDDVIWDVDIQKSLAELNHSKWDSEAVIEPIIDITMTVGSVPDWMMPYTTADKGGLQWVFATLKVQDSRVNYLAFTRDLVSLLSPLLWKKMEHAEAQALWATRCAPLSVKSVNIRLQNFQAFSLYDLESLKDKKAWLTDSHVTLALLDSYQKCSNRHNWGNVRIKLVDTRFWEKLSMEPDAYNPKWRSKENLVGYDFVVMPMFGGGHWRLGIIEKPGGLMEGKTVLHVLDSYRPEETQRKREATRLQKIIIQHFEGGVFEEDRVKIHVAQVPKQPNTNDCGCFVIFLGQSFFENPEWAMSRINGSFSSSEDRLAAWGLETDDLSFVRTDLRALLLKYMKEGHAVVQYEEKL